MAKNILVIYYSQTGQLGDVLTSFLAPLKKENNVEVVQVFPENEIGFPWKTDDFFGAMPSCVLEKPVALKPFSFSHQKYDLVVFGYQPWFLSPSIPATSILVHPKMQAICANTPVITVIGARNMWINSQEMVKKQLAKSNANLVGNVALVDGGNNLTSAVGIVYWLVYGKKESLWGIFPKPGIPDADIKNVGIFGAMAAEHLKTENWETLQHEIVAKKGATIKTNILLIENRAPALFRFWANLIVKKDHKKFWVNAFKYYLFIALFVVSPIVLLVYNIFLVPFSQKKIKAKKAHYLGVN